ncbi:MAG TPA: hypothetical protein VIJ23_03495 [Mycobacterium sp.]
MARQKHTFNPTQSISLTISITGEQEVQVDSHGGRELGSNVVVISDHVAVYVYDLAALATYANGWIDPAVTANHQLPEQADPFGTGPEFTPGVIIRAHGRDEIDHTFDVARKVLIIKIGRVRWLVYDRLAYRSMSAAWAQAKDVGKIMLVSRR